MPAAGQPLSMANVSAASALARARRHPVSSSMPCRFAENSWFNQDARAGYEERADRNRPARCSGLPRLHDERQKDCMSNIGGFLRAER